MYFIASAFVGIPLLVCPLIMHRVLLPLVFWNMRVRYSMFELPISINSIIHRRPSMQRRSFEGKSNFIAKTK